MRQLRYLQQELSEHSSDDQFGSWACALSSRMYRTGVPPSWMVSVKSLVAPQVISQEARDSAAATCATETHTRKTIGSKPIGTREVSGTRLCNDGGSAKYSTVKVECGDN